MRSILTMAAKDLVLATRDLLGLFFIIGFPVLMGLFFGSLYSGMGEGGGSEITLAVVDDDDSPVSRLFVETIDDEKGVVIQKSSRDNALNRVRRGEISGMIAIPKGFGETAGIPWAKGAPLELGVDPSRQAEGAMIQGLVMGASGALVGDRMGELLTQVKTLLRGTPPPTDSGGQTATDAANNKEQKNTSEKPGLFAGFQLANIKQIDVTYVPEPGSRDALIKKIRSRWDISFPQAMLWGVLGCAAAFAVSIVRERKQGTLFRLNAAPISRSHIVLGKAAACFVAVLLVIAMMVALGAALGMRPRSPALLVLASVCRAASFVGVTILMSVIGRTEEAVGGAAWGMNSLMAMFGGGMIPLAFMPRALQPLSQFSPVKWSILSLEGAIWRGFTLREMLLPGAILLAIGAACLALGALRLARMRD